MPRPRSEPVAALPNVAEWLAKPTLDPAKGMAVVGAHTRLALVPAGLAVLGAHSVREYHGEERAARADVKKARRARRRALRR